MLELVDHLANLSALRERDALDCALVSTIQDVLKPQRAAICRAIGDQGNERWRICAQLNAGESKCSSESAWTPLESLPPLQDFPLRHLAVTTQQSQTNDATPAQIVFPLTGTTDSHGVLEIVTDTPLSADSQRLVSGVLRMYINVGKLLDYGERDSLTELLNRKTFDGAFLKATVDHQQAQTTTAENDRRDVRTPGTYWLAMIDIDHFKRVNDTYGHLIGDEVLLLVARLMRSKFRFYDQLYRFGGEEFVVLMRCHGESETQKVLERFRTTTERHTFPQVGNITVSVGFSEIKTGDSPSRAFERADKAVYYAKEHGRNQVCSHAALVSKGELADMAANVGDMELF